MNRRQLLMACIKTISGTATVTLNFTNLKAKNIEVKDSDGNWSYIIGDIEAGTEVRFTVVADTGYNLPNDLTWPSDISTHSFTKSTGLATFTMPSISCEISGGGN